jgi:hypothetical protein
VLPIYRLATDRGRQSVTAQEQEFFSESEVFQALSWGMPDSAARKLAKYMSDDPSVVATIPELQEVGPVATMYSDDMLMLLSLVSVETNRKVERYLEQRRLDGVGWSSPKRAAWEARRVKLREELVKAGKIKPLP